MQAKIDHATTRLFMLAVPARQVAPVVIAVNGRSMTMQAAPHVA